MKTFLSILAIFIFISLPTKAQSVDENWVQISEIESQTIFLNTTGLNLFKDDDIYFWTLEKHDPPLIIESVDGKIAKTKTYYLVNKKIKKYSIMEITYYDSKDNVLANYSYKRNMDNEKYKYNYPVLEDSQMQIIFDKVLSIIESK